MAEVTAEKQNTFKVARI